MVVSVAFLPFALPFFVAGTHVNPIRIALSLVVLMLIPLAVGLLLRGRRPAAAARTRTPIAWLSNVSMVLVVVLTTAGHFKSVLSVFGTLGILAAVAYTVVCAGIGWLLAPTTGTRGVLALGTAQRNAAAAFVVAGQNFADPKVIVMITAILIVEFVLLMPFARLLARGR
jgi:BASS family bile acid:Na+ symporter